MQSSTLQTPNLGESVDTSPRIRRKNPAAINTLAPVIAAADFAVAVLALSVAWWLRFETPLSQVGVPLSAPLTFGNYLGHIFLGATFLVLIFFNFRAYDPNQLLEADDARLVLKCSVVWLICFLGLWLALKIQPSISRIYCVLGAACIFFFVAFWRHLLASYLLPARQSGIRRKVVLVGWSPGIELIAQEAECSAASPFDIGGIFLPKPVGDTANEVLANLPKLGGYTELKQYLKVSPPDGILVVDRDLGGSKLAKIASLCEREMVDFELVPSCFPSLVSGLNMKRVFGVPVLGVTKLPLHSNLNIFLKRGIDIVGSLVGLVISAPVIAVFGFLIRRESPGPIFYKQVRVGQDGRPFEIIKLRSMHTDAERNDHPGWSVPEDPRCLKIGRFMRSWNIDELPQFWNVLKGEMSLVGPRPERPELIAKFKDEILHYNARHAVKPGMTGWAQVNGLRGDTDLTERIRHDLHYIEFWNLPRDIFILVRTFLTKKGAC